MPSGLGASQDIALDYFEGVLPVELDAIDERRLRNHRPRVRQNPAPEREMPGDGPRDLLQGLASDPAPEARTGRVRSPDPRTVFGPGGGRAPPRPAVASNRAPAPRNPDPAATRPQPVPCTATGLALSGGGIRSAAVSLGAIQALHDFGWISRMDYLSTVSGGGYMGACLSAAMSPAGGRTYPFGSGVMDSDAVAHLRNYSNYLLPRGRSGLRNIAEAAVILMRGWVANAVIVGTWLLLAALGTAVLLRGAMEPLAPANALAILLGALLLTWAVAVSARRLQHPPADTRGTFLLIAWPLLLVTLLTGLLGVQPYLIAAVEHVRIHGHLSVPDPKVLASLSAVAGGVSAFSGGIGRFLQSTSRTTRLRDTLLRAAAKALVLVAALIVPGLLWLSYLLLAAALTDRRTAPGLPNGWSLATLSVSGALLSLALSANGFSLHRFYRDRLSKAFLFDPRPTRAEGAGPDGDPPALDDIRLSKLIGGDGPYPILNAALNVQGSREANRRGRNADFFVFTPDFIGSDLTLYTSTRSRDASPRFAATRGMEAVDPRLNLGTAMAISGAAVSANMGSSTIRALSPTLALLNVRLGYWLQNPRWLASAGLDPVARLVGRVRGKLFLLAEMLNLADETSSTIYLTDGGHIENLGVYELLKRGCRLIVAVDAEADPDYSCPSLLKLERYARIDFGVRIRLPWEQISLQSRGLGDLATKGPGIGRCHGPHCAVGRIRYADGARGVLLYVKASLTGDEKDYVLDYWRRNPSFPHQTTGDQFFGEEQFEMYRALGFHMLDGFLSGADDFAFCPASDDGFASAAAARAEIAEAIDQAATAHQGARTGTPAVGPS